MENKKQLLFIPPMSEPLQKLNEVLNGIADDEFIEISIIDDLKELGQFVGSSGQCLIAFSNAKKCATFLQENRFIVAKTHSKVILLTPKEIPAKTLVKFTKIGLTESILETSPPKTLLYKVKLLLRSIKSSGGNEEKELAVKTMSDAGPAQVQAKGEINADKLQTEETAVNYLAEERAKFKRNERGEEESVNYNENLKGKNSLQENAIETHWKSKRKKNEVEIEGEEENSSTAELENSSEIDLYYRGKKKVNAQDIFESDDLVTKRKRHDEIEEDALVGKKIDTFDLNLTPAEAEKRKQLQNEEESDYQQKKTKASVALESPDEKPERPVYTEEEEEKKRKELEELDLLFEEAHKRQKEREALDLGGHYKGKISNIGMDLAEAEETKEKKEYDNSDLYEKEKSLELNLVPVTEEKPRRMQEEEQEEIKRKGFREKIESDLASGDSSTDFIETMMKSNVTKNSSTEIRTQEIEERERPKYEEAEKEDKERGPLDLDLSSVGSAAQKTKTEEESPSLNDKASALDIELTGPDEISSKREKRLEEEEEKAAEQIAKTILNLEEGDSSKRKANSDEENDSSAYRASEDPLLDPEKHSERTSSGKVDKIDTFYRSDKARKKEHDWDLGEKKNVIDFGLEKSKKQGPSSILKEDSADLGEQTIDYRKMKEEFEAIARGVDIEGLETNSSGHKTRNIDDSEDSSFKVFEIDPAGFDFAINILNMIYQKEIKAEEFYRAISNELQNIYHAYPVFYNYRPTDKKHTEVFDSILKMPSSPASEEFQNWWMEYKKDEDFLKDASTKSMATWACREMNWEDVELPAWASNELTNKKVELIYPYFDGLDRMGLAMIYFPYGINPAQAKGIEVTLEMARTLLLDTISRQSSPKAENIEEETVAQKKNMLSVFSGFFKGKKAG